MVQVKSSLTGKTVWVDVLSVKRRRVQDVSLVVSSKAAVALPVIASMCLIPTPEKNAIIHFYFILFIKINQSLHTIHSTLQINSATPLSIDFFRIVNLNPS